MTDQAWVKYHNYQDKTNHYPAKQERLLCVGKHICKTNQADTHDIESEFIDKVLHIENPWIPLTFNSHEYEH